MRFIVLETTAALLWEKNVLLRTIKFKLILNDLLTWEVLHADTSK